MAAKSFSRDIGKQNETLEIEERSSKMGAERQKKKKKRKNKMGRKGWRKRTRRSLCWKEGKKKKGKKRKKKKGWRSSEKAYEGDRFGVACEEIWSFENQRLTTKYRTTDKPEGRRGER
mgnify:CR=1 FL=1